LGGGFKFHRRDVPWPYIDVFDHFKVPHSTAMGNFKRIKLNRSSVLPVEECELYHIHTFCPHNRSMYLDILYPGWRTVCIRKEWTHRRSPGWQKRVVRDCEAVALSTREIAEQGLRARDDDLRDHDA
jgi:hypothetical protein